MGFRYGCNVDSERRARASRLRPPPTTCLTSGIAPRATASGVMDEGPAAQTFENAASVGRGAKSYASLQCANCHGVEGHGGPASGTLKNDNGSAAHVPDISGAQPLKCGDSPARIYTTLMTGLDGTPMASFSELLFPGERVGPDALCDVTSTLTG